MDLRVGLFLNAGEFPGQTHAQIYDLFLAEAELAEQLGYHELWITEHHFIQFGINASSLTAAAYLLGHTCRLHVGTAVMLSPQYHPVQIAEQAAILDQLSGGRFHLGIGRGGYKLDFDIFGTSTERWEQDVHSTADVLLNVWANESASSTSPFASFTDLQVNPRPRTKPHPPLLIASGGGESLNLAARHQLPLQFYFAVPVEARIDTLQRYATAAKSAGVEPDGIDHLHTLIVYVTEDGADEDAARSALLDGIRHSFSTGNHPSLGPDRHRDAQGNPIERDQMANRALNSAMIGTAAQVTEQLSSFIEKTGARRLALFHEMIVEPEFVLASVRRFGEQVLPQLQEQFADGVTTPPDMVRDPALA